MTSLSERLDALGVVPFGDEYVPLSAAELTELTRRLGSNLPTDYVEFVSIYGRCQLNVTVRTVEALASCH